MIYKDVVCWLLFHAKFDCNYIQSYCCTLYLLWDLIVRVVWERESVWRLKLLKIEEVFAGISRLSISQSNACALHMTGMQRVSTNGDSWISRVRPSRKTFCFARLYYPIHTFCTHTIYTHITHKWWGELLRENLAKTLES